MKKEKPIPAPKKDGQKEQELHEEELPQIILSADHESQIGESNLEEGDVVIYLRAVTFTPEVFKNISKGGESAVRDYAARQPAYFLITRKECAGDVLKTLLQASLDPSKVKKEKKDE